MAELETRWWRDLLLIPLIVGLVVAFFTFVLPMLFKDKKEISYIIDQPSAYLTKETAGDLKVTINDKPIKSLYAYKVRFWNSGDVSLTELPIRYVFDTLRMWDKVFVAIHETEPEYEFGEIREEGSDTESKRFVYSLLNPGDRVTATFLSNATGNISFHTKAKGLSVKQVQVSGREKFVKLMSVFVGMIAAILALFFSHFTTTIDKIADRLYILMRGGLKKKSNRGIKPTS